MALFPSQLCISLPLWLPLTDSPWPSCFSSCGYLWRSISKLKKKRKRKGLDETNHSGGYCNNEKLRLSCKWCRDLIGSRPYCWIADCIAPFNPIGLIRFGGMHSLTWGGWLRRAKICFSRNIMIRWDVFKMWVITNIYVLTQIKWGFKCLQHSIILENKRSQDKLIPITPDWGYRSHNFSPLRSHERLQYQKTSEYHQNEYVQKKRR